MVVSSEDINWLVSPQHASPNKVAHSNFIIPYAL